MGTLFKDMPLRPSVLDEYRGDAMLQGKTCGLLRPSIHTCVFLYHVYLFVRDMRTLRPSVLGVDRGDAMLQGQEGRKFGGIYICYISHVVLQI